MAAARAGYGSNGGRVGGGQLGSFKNRINVGDILVTPTAQTRQLLYGESRRRFRESVARRATGEPRSKKAASSQATQMPCFDGSARAIRCARAIRDSVKELGIDIRAGLHTGVCEQIDGKVGGIAVITGARLPHRPDRTRSWYRRPFATSLPVRASSSRIAVCTLSAGSPKRSISTSRARTRRRWCSARASARTWRGRRA